MLDTNDTFISSFPTHPNTPESWNPFPRVTSSHGLWMVAVHGFSGPLPLAPPALACLVWHYWVQLLWVFLLSLRLGLNCFSGFPLLKVLISSIVVCPFPRWPHMWCRTFNISLLFQPRWSQTVPYRNVPCSRSLPPATGYCHYSSHLLKSQWSSPRAKKAATWGLCGCGSG